jgi:uncharacterized membrane protein YadS
MVPVMISGRCLVIPVSILISMLVARPFGLSMKVARLIGLSEAVTGAFNPKLKRSN